MPPPFICQIQVHFLITSSKMAQMLFFIYKIEIYIFVVNILQNYQNRLTNKKMAFGQSESIVTLKSNWKVTFFYYSKLNSMVDFLRGGSKIFKIKDLLDQKADFANFCGKWKLRYWISQEISEIVILGTLWPRKMVGHFSNHFLSKILTHLRFSREFRDWNNYDCDLNITMTSYKSSSFSASGLNFRVYFIELS